MKGSISRSMQCRQTDLHEIMVGVVAGDYNSDPQITGLDSRFIQSIERVSEGKVKLTCQDIAHRDLIPVMISPTDASVIGNFVSSDKSSLTVETRTVVALAAVAAEVEIQDLTYTADTAELAGNDISVEYVEGSEYASLVVQDITYTAVARGVDGNDITIEYTDTVTAGSESASVVGTDIVVEIESGVSTATQVKAAIDASAPALALIAAAITGTAGTAQVTAAAAPLASGGDIVIGVVGDAITVGIETGEHDADAIKAAVDADVSAAALVDVAVSGTGSNIQILQAETNLADGYDAHSAGDVVDATYNLKFLWHQGPAVM